MIVSGVVTRPPGSDGYWPPVGTVVSWTAVQPINDLMEQDLKYPQFSNLGIIGEKWSHLTKHGGHTPWRPGSIRGKVYAKDTACPPGFRLWLIKKCKSNYDTLWIRFWNCDGRQYDNAGNDLGSSGDHHFHCEVQNGYENKRVTLFDDFIKETQPQEDEVAIEAKLDSLIAMLVDGTSTTGNQTVPIGGKSMPRVMVFRRIQELANTLEEMKASQDKLPQVIRDAVSALNLDLTDEQLKKLQDGILAGVNRPTSGTWTATAGSGVTIDPEV